MAAGASGGDVRDASSSDAGADTGTEPHGDPPVADAGSSHGPGGSDGGGGAPGCGATGDVVFEHVELEPSSDDQDRRYGKAIGDLSGDGLPDALLGSNGGRGIVWFEYPDWDRHVIRDSGSWSEDLQIADVDGDGDGDLVAGNSSGVKWYENPLPTDDPRADTWAEHDIGSDGTNVHDLEVGQLDGTGGIDIVIRYEKENSLPARVFLQTGSDGLGWTGSIDVNASELAAEGLGLGDLDGDGDVDIALQNIWCENSGDGTGWMEHPYASGLADQMMVRIADVDGDGRNDILTCPQSGGTSDLAWFSSLEPTGGWVKHTIAASITRMHGLGVGDFNLDGHLDIHTSLRHDLTGGDPKVSIWLSDGASVPTFREQVLARTGSHLSKVGDIGADGDPDIVGANWRGTDPFELWENRCAP